MKNYSIKHGDFVKTGYYFINEDHEKKALGIVNEEFAKRLDDEILRQLSPYKRLEISCQSVSDICNFIAHEIPTAERSVKRIRSELLGELKSIRKQLLIEGAERLEPHQHIFPE